MKPRIALSVLFVLIAATAFAADTAVTQSDAQKSFDQLKTLAGSWEGSFEGKPLHVTLRVTSMGNAVMHEMNGGGPEDPITMFNLDADRLLLTHYCDAGNRPRMVGKMSPDGKTLDFDFLDVSVRNVAAEYRVNPLTVLKGYQELVDEQLVESRRGRGMFVNVGARDLLMRDERRKFLAEEWPRVSATIQRLGLRAEELLKEGASANGRPSPEAGNAAKKEPEK